MKCPRCDGYMTLTKNRWYCKKCKDYTLETPDIVSKPDVQQLSNVDFSDIAHVCPNCLQRLTSDGKYCMHCGTSYPDFDNSQQSVALRQQQIQLKMQLASLAAQQREIAIQQQQLDMQNKQFDAMVKCPKCGSTSISSNKKGYGVVKGAAGAALGTLVATPLVIAGLGAGNIGRQKVLCTCMKCGHRFKAGKVK